MIRRCVDERQDAALALDFPARARAQGGVIRPQVADALAILVVLVCELGAYKWRPTSAPREPASTFRMTGARAKAMLSVPHRFRISKHVALPFIALEIATRFEEHALQGGYDSRLLVPAREANVSTATQSRELLHAIALHLTQEGRTVSHAPCQFPRVIISASAEAEAVDPHEKLQQRPL